MNYFLEKSDQVPWFTNMRDMLHAAQIAAENYDWYLRDIETNFFPDGFSCADQWMPGEQLATLLREHDLQFILAVFSAVPKGFRSIPSSAPYADGNPHFWNGSEPTVQLDGALFAIAC